MFNMGVNVIRRAFNFEPKNIVTLLTTEEWTRGTGSPPVVQGLVWFTEGSRMEGTGAALYGKSVGRRLSISLESYAKFFQPDIYDVLACAYEIQLYGRPEKYVSTCSQVALKAFQEARTYPLVQQC